MRMLVVGHSASRSGSPIVLRNVVRWMRDNTQHEVDVVFQNGGHLQGDFPSSRVLRSGLRGRFAKPLNGAGYDVIYCNSAPALLSLSKPRAPLVLHIHELPWALQIALGEQAPDVLGQVTHFLAPSQPVADMLTGMGLGPSTIVPELIDTSYRTVGPPASPPIVLGCGTLEWRKGADLFLQLAIHYRASHGPQARFVWIGTGYDAQEAQFRYDLAKTDGAVELVAPIDDPWPWFERSSVFALTSREDPLPLVALEAALAGRPLVCFDGSGGIPLLAERGAGVSVQYLNVGAMADEVARLLSDPAERDRIGLTGRGLVQAECSIEVGAPQVLLVLEQAAATQD